MPYQMHRVLNIHKEELINQLKIFINLLNLQILKEVIYQLHNQSLKNKLYQNTEHS